MNLPKLNDLTWGDVISISAWVATVIYMVAVLRADVATAKYTAQDHEQRIRVIETAGSADLRRHTAIDDQRQMTTDAELLRLRSEVATMREMIARIDANVAMILTRQAK